MPVIDTDNGQMDVISRLLKDRILLLGQGVDDEVANVLVAQLLYLANEDPEKDITLYINSPVSFFFAFKSVLLLGWNSISWRKWKAGCFARHNLIELSSFNDMLTFNVSLTIRVAPYRRAWPFTIPCNTFRATSPPCVLVLLPVWVPFCWELGLKENVEHYRTAAS